MSARHKATQKAIKALVKKGQPVFPCHPFGEKAKRPMTKNGLKDASLDKLKIARWWERNPDAAIGIPTGVVWDVLDVDVKNDQDGRGHLPRLRRLGLLDGCQRVVRTPSGGWHLYFPASQGLTNKASAALGLDVRALGGYVLAPPSLIDDGEGTAGEYKDFGAPRGGSDSPLYWDAISGALRPINEDTKKPITLLPSEYRSSVASLREFVANLRSGERNNGLYWAICRCIESGIDPHELVEPAVLSGLGEDEVLLSVSSAMKRAGVGPGDLQSEAEAMFG